MTVSSAVESSLLTPPAGRASASVPADRSPLHLRKEFAITVHAPLDVAVGFFGAHGERVWAGKDWDPQFLDPLPPEDRAGAVFLVPTGDRKRLGLTTIFDRARGHVRHVFVLGDTSVTVIDIDLVPLDPGTTRVTVVYERTALNPGADDEVRTLASGDAAQAPEWEAAINAAAASILLRDGSSRGNQAQ